MISKACPTRSKFQILSPLGILLTAILAFLAAMVNNKCIIQHDPNIFITLMIPGGVSKWMT
jgi:hypothetical protein